MNILLLCDDYWHPGKTPITGIKPIVKNKHTLKTISDADEFSKDMLGDYDVVMLCKSNQKTQTCDEPWMTDEIQKAFTDFVESGGGLLVVHSGTVPSPTTEVMSRLMGCRFTFHPNNCPVTVAPIAKHPVTTGVNMFCEVDEHYRLEIIAEDAIPVMASYSAAQGEPDKYEQDPYHNTTEWLCAAGLVRTQGKGRVCVLTPGHLLEVWLNAEYQKVLDNALNWCAGLT